MHHFIDMSVFLFTNKHSQHQLQGYRSENVTFQCLFAMQRTAQAVYSDEMPVKSNVSLS